MQSDVRHVLLPSENAAWPYIESTCADSQLHFPSSFHLYFFFPPPFSSVSGSSRFRLMRGCFALGSCETDLAYLMNHVEETHMRQKVWKIEEGRKDWQELRAHRLSPWGKQRKNRGTTQAKMVWWQVEACLGAGYIWVPLSTRMLWTGLDCRRAELEGRHAGWG